MMYLKFSIFGLLLYYCSFVQGQEITPPKDWKVIDTLLGNLDYDTIPEKIVIYNTNDSIDFGKHRELRIFKKEKEKWVLWKSSRTALLNSDDGGMMGDPYGGIEIKNKVLTIHHSGGSSWKWGYTDKYRFQNEQFELIGYTATNGKYCEEWATLDFNIPTGQINYKKELKDCQNEREQTINIEKETFYKKEVKINLKKRNRNAVEILSPKLNRKFLL